MIFDAYFFRLILIPTIFILFFFFLDSPKKLLILTIIPLLMIFAEPMMLENNFRMTKKICSKFNLDVSNCDFTLFNDKENLKVFKLVVKKIEKCGNQEFFLKNFNLIENNKKEDDKCSKTLSFKIFSEENIHKLKFIYSIPIDQIDKMSQNQEVLKKIDDFMSPSVSN